MENVEISKSRDMDKPPGRFLKDDAKILAESICETCNLSICHWIFPNACKVANLKPTFKKDKKVDLSNYRPILLLRRVTRNFLGQGSFVGIRALR